MKSSIIVTAMYGLNIKYNVTGYPWKYFTILKIIQARCAEINVTGTRYVIYTDVNTWKHFEKYIKQRGLVLPYTHEVIFLPLEELPEVSRPKDMCGLKLGWDIAKRSKPGALGDLNQVWCNKLWFMKDAASRYSCDNVVWIDCGHKNFQKYLGSKIPRFFKEMVRDTIYTNRYGADTIGGPRVRLPRKDRWKYAPTRGHINPYNIKHRGCKYPHFIMGGSSGCTSDSIDGIYKLFKQANDTVAMECKCFDEETVLSYMFINDNRIKFERW
tara:strand:- start:142 stop:951 length:810 start_codon:yes stop_codon:yes gene_type:complete